MALCIEIGAGGGLQFVSPQPTDTSVCAFVVLSGSEAVQSPFSVSVADAGAISLAVVGVWLVGAAFRLLIQAARVRESDSSE